MKRYAAIVVVLLAFAVSGIAQTARRDGNWWRDRSSIERNAFAIGFFDGIHLGHNFSYWGTIGRGQLPDFERVDSFDEYATKYLNDIRSDQLVDGLNDLYNDYRNRQILLRDAVWLVLNGTAGTPKAELDKMIENYRRNSRQ